MRYVTLFAGCVMAALALACGGGDDAGPEWRTFSAPGVELSLPETYLGGNPSGSEFDGMLSRIESAGQQELANAMRRAGDSFVLFMVDSLTGNGAVVSVQRLEVRSGQTLDDFVESQLENLPESYRLIDQRTAFLAPGTAAVLFAEQAGARSTVQLAHYLLRDRDLGWVVTYSAPESEFGRLLPVFEQSARSLRLPRPADE